MSDPAPTNSCQLKVGGMDCPSCEKTVRSAVEKMPGVRAVTANHLDMLLTVEGSGPEFHPDSIIEGIRRIGYRPERFQRQKRTLLRLEDGIDLEEEAQIRSLLEIAGATLFAVDPDAGTITVSHETELEEVLAQLRRGKIRVRVAGADAGSASRGRLLPRLSLALCAVTLGAGFAAPSLGLPLPVGVALFIVSIISGGWETFHKGLMAMLRRSLDMNTLMSLAVIGAVAIGEYGEGATVMFLGAIANFLEGWSMKRARAAVRKLMELAPPTALLSRDGAEREVPLADVRLGERMIIRPGARIPLDGVVRDGISDVDQSPVTGESVPVSKEAGSRLFAGSINTSGTLIAEVTALVEESTVARIIHMVQEAQGRRSDTERFIDRFAAIYTPAAVAFAALIAILPPLFVGDWSGWFYRALVLLVIACPCALVISTPVGIVAGLAAAARAGVLIKGGKYLETAAAIDTVAFDKTGTLTLGKPRLLEIIPANGAAPDELLRLAAALERHSEHPLGAAIVRAARERGIDPPEPQAVRALPGRGIEGSVDGQMLHIGNPRMMADLRVPLPANPANAAFTNVYLAAGKRLLATMLLGDSVRPEARAAISSLTTSPGMHTLMLSGDSEAIVESIAKDLGIDSYHAGLLPQDKLAILEETRASGRKVMMIGDGINDAPALAAADLGVAMGAVGTDVAIETADIALMSDDVRKIPWLIRHSRRTLGLIRQNIGFSIGVKLAFVALSVLGLASLWMAVLADTGLSLLVTANSLRLLRTRAF